MGARRAAVAGDAAAEVDEERLRACAEPLRQAVAFWRQYPDRFVDFLCSLNPSNTFSLYFYQRVMLRAMMRHKSVFVTMTRGASKSFISVLTLMLRAVLYPGNTQFVVSGVKSQSASIVKEKVAQICRLIPALDQEIVWDTRGTSQETKQTKDSVSYTFKNGSVIRNVVAGEQSRGLRFNGGLMEECVSLDQTVLQEILIPMMNVDRTVNGKVADEPANKSRCFITTAGYKQSSSYENLVQILCESVVYPKRSIVLGADWRLPVREGLLSKEFVKELKANGGFNEASFEREYGSRWMGDACDAFFTADKIDSHRKLLLAETQYNNKLRGNDHYVMGVDVGRHGCTTEVVILKVTQADSTVNPTPLKQLVNLYTFDEEHFGLQAINIKRLFQRFKCKCCVVDANGLGTGLVDFLVMDQKDPDTGELLPNLGVFNDEEGRYRRFSNERTVHGALYLMKANQAINSALYSYTQAQLLGGRLLFLVDETAASAKLDEMSQRSKLKRDAYLRPYVLTSVLEAQMLNLVLNQEGAYLVLKQASRRVRKDKFSALIYALSFCKLEEERTARRRLGNRGVGRLKLYSKGAGLE
jgi:hypothetical protein